MLHARTDYDRIQDPALAERPEVQELIDSIIEAVKLCRPFNQVAFLEGTVEPLLGRYLENRDSFLASGSSPIGRDEPVFLIRGKDAAAMAALYAWANESRRNGVDEAVCQHVEQWALTIQDWQHAHGYKNADVAPEFLRK